MRTTPNSASPAAVWVNRRSTASTTEAAAPHVPNQRRPAVPAGDPLRQGGGRRFESVRGLCKVPANQRLVSQPHLHGWQRAPSMELFMKLSGSSPRRGRRTCLGELRQGGPPLQRAALKQAGADALVRTRLGVMCGRGRATIRDHAARRLSDAASTTAVGSDGQSYHR